MLIRCTHCQGSMRLDNKDLGDKPRIKIRCPHCQGVGYIENRSAPKPIPNPIPEPIPQASPPEEPPLIQPYTSKLELPGSLSDKPEMKYDASLPEDAFNGFRFPAEQEDRRNNSRNTYTGRKIIILAVASLVVVLFFALLVNIILPGPVGIKGVSGTLEPEEEQTITKAGGGIEPLKGSVPAPPRQR